MVLLDYGTPCARSFASFVSRVFILLPNRLRDEDAKCLVAMYDQAQEFFALPQYFKDSVCPYQPALEIGYSHVPRLAKEFFAVNRAHALETISSQWFHPFSPVGTTHGRWTVHCNKRRRTHPG
jgi:hypothetical protein